MILLIFVMGITSALAKAPSEDPSAVVVAKADSLFATRQFTQAGDLYQSVFQKHHYSPAMLLRMAFIHEGLGRLGESLFYLNLYHLASSDPQALKKMEELAEKNRLQG